MGCVYLMSCNEFTKIGVSAAHSAYARRIEMQNGNPYPVEVAKTYALHNYMEVESVLHEEFSHARHRGEWFILSSADIDIIDSIVKSIGVPIESPQMELINIKIRSRGSGRFGFYDGRSPIIAMGYLSESDMTEQQISRLRKAVSRNGNMVFDGVGA